MKIRTQLLLACFLLAVLPLTGIVFYSYRSSRRAIEGAYHKEATRLTAQMDRRLTTIRADLDQRLAGLSAIPLGDLQKGATPGTATHSGMVDNILMAMGEAAPLVDALEFVPAPTPPTPPVAAPAIVAQPAPVASPRLAVRVTPPVPPAPRIVVSDTELTEPIVIDLPPVTYPKFTMPADFPQRVAEITKLSVQLGDASLTQEQRAAIQQTMKDKQEQLNESVSASREEFHDQMEKTNDQRHEREMVIERRREAALAQREAASAQRQATRVVTVRSLSPEQRLELKSKEKQAGLLFGHRFNVSLHSDGKVVGQIRAQLSTDEVIKRVLGAQNDDTAEIPFAVDRENNVYTRNASDRATLDRLGIIEAIKSKKPLPHVPNWVVAMSYHKESGLHI